MPSYNDLVTRLYQYWPTVVSDLIDDRKHLFCKDNPLFTRLQHKTFCITKKDKLASTATLFYHPQLRQAFIGFFETVDDQISTAALFNEIDDFAKTLSITILIGPVNGSLWDKYRLSTDDKREPFTSEPFNRGYYLHHWINAGFKVIQKNTSLVAPVTKSHISTYRSLNDKSDGCTFTRLTPKNALQHLATIHQLIADSFIDNPLFTVIPLAEFAYITKPLLKTHLLAEIVYNKSEPIGFYVGFLDRNIANTAVIKTLAITPSYRGHGWAKKLFYRFLQQASTEQAQQLIFSTIRNNNRAISHIINEQKVYRNYNTYLKNI